VSATFIKVTTLDFDGMPATGIKVVVTGFTTQVVKNIEGNITLEFYIEERIGKREPSDFWLEIPQRGCATLSRMGATTTRRSQNLQAALKANPVLITTEQTD
ncbi:3274_t:CDS:2, partial [Cetraspora pellucida]